MKSSGWSSLVLGTILAASAVSTSLAQSVPDGEPPVASLRTSIGGTGIGDDAAMAIDAARGADRIAEEEITRVATGSIVPLEPGGRAGGLGELSPPAAGGLAAPKAATRPAETAKPVTDEAAQPAAPEVARPAGVEPTSERTAAPPRGNGAGEAVVPAAASAAEMPAATGGQERSGDVVSAPTPDLPASPTTSATVLPTDTGGSPAPTGAAATETIAAPASAPAAAAPAAAPTTDAAIAATIAAEKAAAALRAALEQMQPLAGSAEERADRAALLAFYSDRAFLPLLVDAQGSTDRGRAAQRALARAGEDGLEPRDYALPRVEAGLEPDRRAEVEITFARTVVRYARHLQTGRFDPGRVSELVTPEPPRTEAREVLDRVAASADVAATLVSYAPPHVGYARLKAMLADLRGAAPEPPLVVLPVGPTLKPGQRDARVALLRERLGMAETASDADVFDPALAAEVKAYQRDRGLSPTGTVGRETVSALNGEKTGTAARIADIVSNMERWRWLPRDLGELHVFVNVPDFHLDVMKDGRSIHRARVIVGRPSNPTPIFSDTMRLVVVNPYWNVPYSIVKKEMLGQLQSSGGRSLSRGGYEVRVGRQVVDPATIDWATVNAANVSIRQAPGDGNALGNIKFLFPNQHAVYLHDTSSRGLFAKNFRALSHGCVRVQEPFSFADAVLSEEPERVDGARLKKMIGGGEKTINLKRPVPVHLAYFTTWVDDAGQLQNRPDLYGHDAKVKRLLGL